MGANSLGMEVIGGRREKVEYGQVFKKERAVGTNEGEGRE